MLKGMKKAFLKVSTYGGCVMDCIFQDEGGFSCGGKIHRHTSTLGPNSVLIDDPEINWPTLKMYVSSGGLKIYHWDKKYLSQVRIENISNWAGRPGADITIKSRDSNFLFVVPIGGSVTIKADQIQEV